MTNLFRLKTNFSLTSEQDRVTKELLAGLRRGFDRQILLGVTGCGKTFTIANVLERAQRPALIIAHNKTLAAQLYGEMKSFFPENSVEYFVSYYDYYQPEAYLPTTDTYIEKDASINEHIDQMRLAATKAIIERKDVIIVATVSAIYGLGDPISYFDSTLSIAINERVNQRDILSRLTELQYLRNDIEFKRGTYRVHGGIIDIFPAESDREGVRIELDDEKIINITNFDPLTNTTVRKKLSVTIFPKTHYITSRKSIEHIVNEIKSELSSRLKELYQNNKLIEAQRLQERVYYDMEMLLEFGYCNGIENYSRYLSSREPGEPPPTLMDYLPKNSLLIIDESHVTVPQIGGMYRGDRSRKETLVAYGFRLPSALDNRPLCFDEFAKLSLQTIYVSATPGEYEIAHSEATIELLVRPTGLVDPRVVIKPVDNQVEDLLIELKWRIERKERVLVTALTKRMAEHLCEYLVEQGVKARYLHADIDTVERVEILRDLRLGVFDVLVGINLLREGLDLPEVSLVAILDADKEGFLRSKQSLIQTSGRAARNINGTVVMYADKITGSIERALQEMDRRRRIQIEFNLKHKITPKSIEKKICDIMENVHKKEAKIGTNSIDQKLLNKKLSEKELKKKIKELEKKMLTCARNLEFEKAALLRDEIARLF